MGFFRVKAGPEKVIIVNRDCGARVVLDYLKDRLSITEAEEELDLCDEWGNLRLLTQAPLRCSCLHLVAPRALYTPVVIKKTPTLKFEFPLGWPVTSQKPREAKRKVRRQWERFQKLRGAADGQSFASDEEAVAIICQVVGSPSVDFVKGKNKARDPAPRPARPRSTSAPGRKKKTAAAVNSSEEKENEQKNVGNKAETSTTALKVKKTVSIVIDQEGNGARSDRNVPKESKGAKGNDKRQDNATGKEAQSAVKSTEVNEPKDSVPGSPTNKPNKVPIMENNQPGEIRRTPSGSTKANDKVELRQRGASVDKPTENPRAIVPVKDNETIGSQLSVVGGGTRAGDHHQVHESTDSGIESAASRSHGRQLKGNEVRSRSSDNHSISVEAGSNDESTGESVLSQSKTGLRHHKRPELQSIVEQGDSTQPENVSAAARARLQTTYDRSENQNEEKPDLREAAALNKDRDEKMSVGESPLDMGSTGEIPVTAPVDVPQIKAETIDDETISQVRADPTKAASDPPQELSAAAGGADTTPGDVEAAPEDIAGVTVSILPPSLAAPHRRSVDVTALLGIPTIDKTAALKADRTTRKGVPSLIDEEWRQKTPAEQLIGVICGTSKLVYIGSAKSSQVSGRQLDVISTTEKEAERLGVQRDVSGPLESSTPPKTVDRTQEDVTASQGVEETDTWKSPSSAIGT